jgi:hypothetical protein
MLSSHRGCAVVLDHVEKQYLVCLQEAELLITTFKPEMVLHY